MRLSFFRQIKIVMAMCLLTSLAYAQPDGFGQLIQINTDLHSIRGNPSWLIIIRDLDHGQNLPYLYDFTAEPNTWFAFTYSRNYLILTSTLSIEIYNPRENRYKKYKIHNFCNLENGRIHHDKSISINISGKLTTNANLVSCQTLSYLLEPS